jgi:hypothetical protein
MHQGLSPGQADLSAATRNGLGSPRYCEGGFVSCQTTIEGDFVRTFTHSPVGTLEPNGAHVVFALHNFFRYDEQGTLAEEWIQTDGRATLTQLGGEGQRGAGSTERWEDGAQIDGADRLYPST